MTELFTRQPITMFEEPTWAGRVVTDYGALADYGVLRFPVGKLQSAFDPPAQGPTISFVDVYIVRARYVFRSGDCLSVYDSGLTLEGALSHLDTGLKRTVAALGVNVYKGEYSG